VNRLVSSRRGLEDAIVAHSHRLHERGWVANHDGNVTARLEPERFLATPTSVSKAAVSREMLIVVDAQGRVVSGSHKPFGELELHLFVYRRRPDVSAVLHAHPPAATGLAVAGMAVRTDLLAEPVVSLGDRVPLCAYARPGTPESTLSLLPFVEAYEALLLESHGVLAYGPDLETAFLRLELVEHLARIQLAALQAGGLRSLPEADVTALLETRAKAGLGAKGRSR
jgi:L-fuculose-phosphate aldolase